MKTIIALTICLVSLGAQALPIKNFFPVSETEMVLRGSQPLGKAQALREAGVEQVLIFKNETKDEVAKEKSELIEAGFNAHKIHHIPFLWKEMDLDQACLQTVEALQLLIKAETAQEPIFFHCTVGEDRTGMLAGLYKMISEGVSQEEAFQSELCDRGYADGNANKPQNVVREIEKGLTPLFVALASKIEAEGIRAAQVSKKICKNLQFDFSRVPSCI